jgi:hypothetical protein
MRTGRGPRSLHPERAVQAAAKPAENVDATLLRDRLRYWIVGQSRTAWHRSLSYCQFLGEGRSSCCGSSVEPTFGKGRRGDCIVANSTVELRCGSYVQLKRSPSTRSAMVCIVVALKMIPSKEPVLKPFVIVLQQKTAAAERSFEERAISHGNQSHILPVMPWKNPRLKHYLLYCSILTRNLSPCCGELHPAVFRESHDRNCRGTIAPSLTAILSPIRAEAHTP